MNQLSIINFLVITIAGIINAIGVTMFLAPVNLYDSGISGTSMLFAQMTPDFMTLSIFLILLNFPLFVFGMKKQGSVFTIYSLYAVAVYSIVSFLIINILPVNVSIASPLAEQDLFLCALFGGMISGVGSGLTIRFGGAIDGIEVMAVIFAKRLGITVGTFCMCYNVVLYVIIGIIKSNWILPLYSIVTYMAALKTIDFIVEGLDRDKTAIIVTSKEQEICNALSEEFGTGITLINAKGYYSNEEKTMVYLVVNRFQIGKMNAIIHALDENAFITITENI
ncbi:YitT family protein [Emergencia timonensis]|uniref:YitT family protein n=1 Tax=Emergencia timonensis TaxID=1776384 RepID=A0A415E5F0_9FIRM|nr:YitT family protein [Emergencia timonensis]